MAIEHLLFYQHNVQSFMLGHTDKYQGIIVPLSVATAFKDGTDGFIRALCKNSPAKAYMIDPRSALFQAQWNRSNKRDAHKRMASQLGKIVQSTLEQDKPLALSELSADAIKDIVATSLSFQLSFGQNENPKLKKYAKLAGVPTLGKLDSPRRLIPPYFQFGDQTDDWYSKSKAILVESKDYLSHRNNGLLKELCPVLHIRNFTNEINWKSIAADLVELQIQMVFLYPNNLHETEATQQELEEYRSAVEAMTAEGLRCYSLHGGYFAIILSKYGLAGFGNGIGYGEWRNSGYHKGGQANIRIYVPKLHRYCQPNEVQALLAEFGDFIAEDSDLLSALLKTGGSALSVSAEQANEHFLACRAAELKYAGTSKLSEIKKDLADTSEVLAKCKAGAAHEISEKSRDTLVRWVNTV